MCFYNDDYDWYASYNIWDGRRMHNKGERCVECGERLRPGSWGMHVYQQEHEDCKICSYEWSDWYDPDQDPRTCQHDYGEQYEAWWCLRCSKVLAGIYQVEMDEGCPEHARQPDPECLRETFLEHSGARDYARKTIELFPELQGDEMLEGALT